MNEIQKYSRFEEIEKTAAAMVASKFFADAGQVSQAIVKIMAGQEIGIGAFASMTGIHIISGKPTYGANILAAKVKGSGRYDYRVKLLDEKACEIEFFQQGQPIGVSRFTLDDAKKAGTKNLDKFARNMLFARAMSNGIKWFTPDVLGGVTAYVPEEFSAVVDDDNNIIEAEHVTTKSQPAPQPQPEPDQPISDDYITEEEAEYIAACEVTASDGERYGDRTNDKLAWVATNPKSPADKRHAAQIILNWRNAHK